MEVEIEFQHNNFNKIGVCCIDSAARALESTVSLLLGIVGKLLLLHLVQAMEYADCSTSNDDEKGVEGLSDTSTKIKKK